MSRVKFLVEYNYRWLFCILVDRDGFEFFICKYCNKLMNTEDFGIKFHLLYDGWIGAGTDNWGYSSLYFIIQWCYWNTVWYGAAILLVKFYIKL